MHHEIDTVKRQRESLQVTNVTKEEANTIV
jgi:hypothetical protein